MSTCSIEFPQLVNKNGKKIHPGRVCNDQSEAPVRPGSFRSGTERCGSLSVLRYLIAKGFDGVVESLTNAKDTTFLDVDNLLYEGLAWTNSDAYVACEQSATSLLKAMPVKSTVNATVCPYDYWKERALYMKDPCCNRVAAFNECCSLSAREYDLLEYKPNQSSVEKLCTNSKCLIPAVQELANLESSDANPTEADDCRGARLKALSDPRFTSLVAYEYCIGNVYTLRCEDGPSRCIEGPLSLNMSYVSKSLLVYGPKSYCTGLNACAIPCKENSDCYGSNYGRQYVDGYCELYGFKSDSSDEEGLVQCLKDRLDPYISVHIKEIVEAANTAASPYSAKFFQAVTVDGCSKSKYTTKEACEAAEFCNWANCDLGDVLRSGTVFEAEYTRELCEANHFGGDKFCAYCANNYDCAEYSQFPACVILNSDYVSNRTLCESSGNSWNPLPQLGPSYSCAKLNTNLAQCMDHNFCGMFPHSR